MPGGSGGRGGRNKGPLPRSVQVSKKLSWLLRHGAESEGLKLDAGGFVNLHDVLTNRNLRSFKVSFDEVRQVVADNDKQRFTIVPVDSEVQEEAEINGVADGQQSTPLPSEDPKDWKIRANQGHSLKVESEGLLEPITIENQPETAVHGTTHAAWPLIVASGGLKAMGRNHVHFASGLPAGFKSVIDLGQDGDSAAAPVISGMRMSSRILMFLDIKKAMGAGLSFGRSDNGVILTEGNENGIVPLEFFTRVEERTGEGVLVEDGKVVKEAPEEWRAKGKNRGKGRS